jgi:RNA polymerase sigma factor (sigma-70 family)
MSVPKPPYPPIPPDLLAELLALRPFIEHILCDGSRDPHERAAAKDHVQTVLRKAVQHLPTYQPHEEGMRPWVSRIARNEKIDVCRSEQRHHDALVHIAADVAPGAVPSPEREAQVRVLLEKVKALIQEMPPDMRDVLILAGSSEDPHEDIAAQFRISKDAAKMRLLRARRMLRERAGAIRDHIGVWLLFVLRKLAESRGPLVARFRTFCWQASHLWPPLLIGFFALPQYEPPPPMVAENAEVVAENAVIASTRHEPSPYVPDERRPVVERAVRVIPPEQPRFAPLHASDKPRRPKPSRHDFNVVLPPTNVIPNGRR